MDHPDKPAAYSRAPAGEVRTEPEKVISVVLTDEDNDPAGVLEQWGRESWIFAPAEDLVELE